MSYPKMFMENVKIVPGIAHATGAGARTSDRVSLENYSKLGILITIYQGAVNTTAITVDKVTAATAGTESTGIMLNNWWSCVDVTAGTTADTWTKGTAAVSITSSATGSGTSYYWIEIDSDELRTVTSAVDYKFIELELGASNAGNFLYATFFLFGSRYGQAALPSAQA